MKHIHRRIPENPVDIIKVNLSKLIMIKCSLECGITENQLIIPLIIKVLLTIFVQRCFTKLDVNPVRRRHAHCKFFST